MSPISDTVAAVLLVALATAVTFAGIQTVRLAEAKAAHETTKRVHAEALAENERATREAAAEDQRLAAKHATHQQEKTHAFEIKVRELERDGAAVRDQLARVRKSVASYADRTAPGGDHAAAVAGQGDRSETLGGLVLEGAELVAEARVIIQRRDAEVSFLYGLLSNDRAACQP